MQGVDGEKERFSCEEHTHLSFVGMFHFFLDRYSEKKKEIRLVTLQNVSRPPLNIQLFELGQPGPRRNPFIGGDAGRNFHNYWLYIRTLIS